MGQLFLAVAGDLDVGVPGNGKKLDIMVLQIQESQDDGVGPGGFITALVRAQKENVHSFGIGYGRRGLGIPGFIRRHGGISQPQVGQVETGGGKSDKDHGHGDNESDVLPLLLFPAGVFLQGEGVSPKIPFRMMGHFSFLLP